MRITKYPQSCLVVEVEGARLAIDPGTLVTARYDVAELGPLDAVLYTHRHHDHLDVEVVDRLVAQGVALFGNADVVELLGPTRCALVEDARGITVGGDPRRPARPAARGHGRRLARAPQHRLRDR
jgi:L-ascorbate metabolism protein UlaG (beta-lactamase superfamily)